MNKPCIVGIAGGSASGKTTIVNKLKASLVMIYLLSAMTLIIRLTTTLAMMREQGLITTILIHLTLI